MGVDWIIVPEGPDEGSQAIDCLEAVKKRIRPVRHGVKDFVPELLVRKRVRVPRDRACPSRTRTTTSTRTIAVHLTNDGRCERSHRHPEP
jgi:hypothetical protein